MFGKVEKPNHFDPKRKGLGEKGGPSFVQVMKRKTKSIEKNV